MSAEYDPIDHLNAIFSHPSTLTSVAAVRSSLQRHQDELELEIAALVASQRKSDAGSVERIQAARATLPVLFNQIEEVRARAEATESAIADMTADIKRLDGTKRNLTSSMTALKRLQMLTTAYEQLRALGKTRQYRECAQLLQAVIQLVAHFKSYRSIDQIATLHRNIVTLQSELLEQVCDDFERTFAQDEVAQRKGILAEGCQVMDALGDHARARLVTWYCNTELREYRQVFRGNDEAGSLDNISRRYSWFGRMMKTHDQDHASIFPLHWRVGEMLANAFCEGTRDDFKAILQKSVRRADSQPLDVNLLLSCLQETLNFEHGLEKRFIGESRSSVDTMASKDDKPQAILSPISEAFEPYMTLWVESQDKQLAQLIPKYRQESIRKEDEEFAATTVISSSTELFHFYRLALAQCAKLSTGSRLLELSRTFGKYLDTYGQQVLLHYLLEQAGPRGPSLEATITVLNTADYCYNTINQLEEKIRGSVDDELKSEVDLQSQADNFIGIANSAIRILVKGVEQDLDLVWREMRNYPWSRLETVVDQSSYVTEMIRIMQDGAKDRLRYLHKVQYFRSFCDNLVEGIVMAYCSNVFQCKPVSEVGAEQMLLDSYAVKKGLLELPTLLAEPGTQPAALFIKRATQATAKMDSLLKTLQVRPSPPEALVQAYLIHIGDRSESNFKKILELKGIRKSEQRSLTDLFNAHCQAPANASLPASSAFLSAMQLTGPSTGSTGTMSAKDLAPSSTLVGGRFDATTLGNALISVAREGVDRLGTPNLVTSGGESTSASPGPGESKTTANINENLKSFGKFFTREGGFGRFGRGSDGGSGGAIS